MDADEVFGKGKKYLHVAYEVGEQNKASYADKHAEQNLTAKGACNKILPIRTAYESIIEQTISTIFKSNYVDVKLSGLDQLSTQSYKIEKTRYRPL